VTLTGEVLHQAKKMEPERLVKAAAGVQAVANDIQVRVPGVSVQSLSMACMLCRPPTNFGVTLCV
jgi:hypothetical protein